MTAVATLTARHGCGLAIGTDKWRAWNEIWLPDVGWIPQDVWVEETMSPAGLYSYGFATVIDLNRRAAVARASAHLWDNVTYGPLWKGEVSLRVSSGNPGLKVVSGSSLALD